MHQILATNPYLADAIRRGLQAIGWIVEERGLGGTDTSDGLAWSLPLEVLWENYVESHYRSESRMTGATIRVGRLGETTFPIRWRQSLQRSLSQLVPDLVLQRAREIHVVDANTRLTSLTSTSTDGASFRTTSAAPTDLTSTRSLRMQGWLTRSM
ncbi:MAG TPA: hypothetical protein VE505_03570 [Vicinamibacterales bacterium]|nr:hypothetical protein [Vicinamibacterales bacterium]